MITANADPRPLSLEEGVIEIDRQLREEQDRIFMIPGRCTNNSIISIAIGRTHNCISGSRVNLITPYSNAFGFQDY